MLADQALAIEHLEQLVCAVGIVSLNRHSCERTNPRSHESPICVHDRSFLKSLSLLRLR